LRSIIKFEATVQKGTTVSARSEIGIANWINLETVDIKPDSTI